MTESREKILHLYNTLKKFLNSLEPKMSLIKNKKMVTKEEEKLDVNQMDIDEDQNLNLEQMQKKFIKGVSSNKNKINMFEVK